MSLTTDEILKIIELASELLPIAEELASKAVAAAEELKSNVVPSDEELLARIDAALAKLNKME